jgi:hypothetical protein
MNAETEPENHDTVQNSEEPKEAFVRSPTSPVIRPAAGFVSQQNLPTPLGSAWLGIVFAGGCFPLVVLTVGVIVSWFWGDTRIFTPGWFPDALFFLFFTFLSGSFYAMAGSIPAYCLLQFGRFCTHWILTQRGACGVYGGLTGFLCTTGGGLYFPQPTISLEEIASYICLVAIAITLGHLGGIHSCYMKRGNRNWFKSPFFDPSKRISLKFLMGLTAAVALFVAACKAVGETGLSIGIAWSMYGLLQTLLLVVEHAWRTRISGMPFENSEKSDAK